MFCASDDFSRELASIDETCEGFDESINGPYPDCVDGLECRDAGIIFSQEQKNLASNQFTLTAHQKQN